MPHMFELHFQGCLYFEIEKQVLKVQTVWEIFKPGAHAKM